MIMKMKKKRSQENIKGSNCGTVTSICWLHIHSVTDFWTLLMDLMVLVMLTLHIPACTFSLPFVHLPWLYIVWYIDIVHRTVKYLLLLYSYLETLYSFFLLLLDPF